MATPPHIPHETPPPDVSRGHEHGDLRLKGVIVFVVTMTIAIILIQWGVTALLRSTRSSNGRQDATASPLLRRGSDGKIEHAEPPGPLLQPFGPQHSDLPYQDLLKMQAQNRAILSSYGAAPGNPDDPSRARIPIQRAMQLIAQQGFQERGTP